MIPRPGEPFGRYDIVSRLGQGGMGVVFSAVHRDLQREVALKVLSPDLSEESSYRNRFLREAQALARLDSPNVVRIHDAGEQDGWLFLATELVPDGDLAGLLAAEGALPAEVALDVVRQVAEGLAAAHAAGILHRDIKPSNVLIRRLPDGRLRAVLCDFGIAAVADVESTATVGVIGTPSYMAPERHEGAPASVASDIYSLGCLLWAALTGKAPYEGSAAQVLLGHLQAPVPQLPGTSPLQVEANRILVRSLAKAPEQRPGDVAAFIAGLERTERAQHSVEATLAVDAEKRQDTVSVTVLAPDPVFEEQLAPTQAAPARRRRPEASGGPEAPAATVRSLGPEQTADVPSIGQAVVGAMLLIGYTIGAIVLPGLFESQPSLLALVFPAALAVYFGPWPAAISFAAVSLSQSWPQDPQVAVDLVGGVAVSLIWGYGSRIRSLRGARAGVAITLGVVMTYTASVAAFTLRSMVVHGSYTVEWRDDAGFLELVPVDLLGFVVPALVASLVLGVLVVARRVATVRPDRTSRTTGGEDGGASVRKGPTASLRATRRERTALRRVFVVIPLLSIALSALVGAVI